MSSKTPKFNSNATSKDINSENSIIIQEPIVGKNNFIYLIAPLSA